MSRPIKHREQFFKLVEDGLQQYFDQCDRYWGGILHLTVGVKCGKVGGIIKSENMLSYEGFTLHRVETILKYVLPRFVSRDSVPYAIAAVLDELRTHGEEPTTAPTEEYADEQPKPKGRPKKQNTKQSTLNTKQANTETHEQEETEGQPR
ncbi:MAG: hypothetical protein J6S11_04820 [Bacteroidaceae bacterium]|nr:hypothetical protein [Bacteroidaceae bacterium]